MLNVTNRQTTMRRHVAPVRTAIIRKSTNSSAGEDVEEREPRVPLARLQNGVEDSAGGASSKQNLKIEPPRDPALPLLLI